MTDVEKLPFDVSLGYPQQQKVSINDIAYTLYFRWNPEDDGFVVLTILRISDSAMVCNTRIDNLTPVRALDPVTKILQFMVFPYWVSSSSCELWVFYD